MRIYLLTIALAFLLWIWPEASGFALFAMLAPPLCDSSCCSTPCPIYSDDFSTDKTGTDYSIRSGSWSVSGGKLTCTSASGLLRCETASDSGATSNYSIVSVKPYSSSDSGGPVFAYTDDNNYWYAVVQPGSGFSDGTLKLYQVSSGTPTQRGTTQNISGFNTLAGAGNVPAIDVCVGYGNGFVVVSAGTKAIDYYASSVTVSSKKAGIMTGSGSSSVVFDNFRYSRGSGETGGCLDCGIEVSAPSSPCTSCCTGGMPLDWLLTVPSSATARTCGATTWLAGCNTLAGSYVLAGTSCNMSYSATVASDGATCTFSFTTAGILIWAALVTVSTNVCKLTVDIVYGYSPQDPADPAICACASPSASWGKTPAAYYESDTFAKGDCFTLGTITLNKIGEGANQICHSFPSSLTLGPL